MDKMVAPLRPAGKPALGGWRANGRGPAVWNDAIGALRFRLHLIEWPISFAATGCDRTIIRFPR